MRVIKNPCSSTKTFGEDLKDACSRLKNEEFGYELAVEGYTCAEIAGILRSLGYSKRPSFTADSDYDFVKRYRKGRQLHVRLRDYPGGCLITMHDEPDDIAWHISCGFADKIFGDEKPEWCKASYLSPEELQSTLISDIFQPEPSFF